MTTMTDPGIEQGVARRIDQFKADSGVGVELHERIRDLYPICRSITGDGFRETMRQIASQIPDMTVQEVASGTEAFDWTVPQEWNIRDAYVRDSSGRKVIDFKESNLHVVSYSEPIHEKMTWEQLRPHLHTLPEYPNWIPYRTSYYRRDWGFCLTENKFQQLGDGTYEVCIDSTLEDGYLNYGEWFHEGQTSDEMLITCHACHPSLCNDNLSGVVIATELAKILSGLDTRLSYRVLFLPGGIGSVIWMSRNAETIPRIKHGLVLSCLGDTGSLTYKKSRQGNTEIDQAAQNVLRTSGRDHQLLEFSPYGYDERNFCSPRFNLPVGSLTRSTHSSYDGYHSSGDDLDIVKPECLADSLTTCLEIVEALERNDRFLNLIPEAEPQLGRRGLYGMMGGLQERADTELALLWVMNLSDGEHSLIDISDRSDLPLRTIAAASEMLVEQGILRRAAPGEKLCPA